MRCNCVRLCEIGVGLGTLPGLWPRTGSVWIISSPAPLLLRPELWTAVPGLAFEACMLWLTPPLWLLPMG